MDTERMANEMFDDLCRLVSGPAQQIQTVVRGEMGVLGYLVHVGGTASPTEISRTIGVSSARITNVLNGLERKGYIVRTPSPGDRRRVLGTVTGKGWQYAARCREEAIRRIERLLDALGEEDARESRRLVGRILELSRTGQVPIVGLPEPPEEATCTQ